MDTICCVGNMRGAPGCRRVMLPVTRRRSSMVVPCGPVRDGAIRTSPDANEAQKLNVREAQKLVDALVRRNKLVKVGEDLYYPPGRLQALMDALASAMEAAGQMTLAEARDLLGTSRRFSQALLEHMDSEGMTLRVGDARRLRRRRR